MKKILKQILKRIGYSIHKIKKTTPKNLSRNPYLTNLLNVLKEIGFSPYHVIDVGANRGYWTRDFLIIFPDSAITMIEPQEDLKKYFQDILVKNQKLRFYPIGVGKEKGSFAFTIHKNDDSSTFLLNEHEASLRGFTQKIVPVNTLNNLIREQQLQIPDLVKIDAEGLDLEVLEGASDLFGHTEIFMVEAAVNNPFFQNTFIKVINYMDEKGYRLFDITDNNRPFKTRMLWLVELVFVKKGGIVDQYRISDFNRN